ncbi:LysR substrate-binding domain-containing protein [Vulgatibacter incomptus]|nr:LysR substrate-binding domain-containing protein [Vulgatibacter incomptus]
MDFTHLPFTLRQLQYAVAVADERSFRRAAEACHVSQPSLSAQVAELEGALGVQLFERDRTGVLLTQAGEALVERSRRLLVEARDVGELARRFVDPLSGMLRFGVIPTLGPYLLPEIVPGLRKAFPKLTLLWTEAKTGSIVEALGRGELDVAILAREAELGDLEHVELSVDPFVLAAPRGHRLSRAKGPVSIDELAGERVLLLDDGHCFRDQALSFCSSARLDELNFRATSLPTLVQMVASGLGVTLLPAIAVATETRGLRLAVREIASPAPGRTIVLAWRRRSPFGHAFGSIAERLRESLAA